MLHAILAYVKGAHDIRQYQTVRAWTRARLDPCTVYDAKCFPVQSAFPRAAHSHFREAVSHFSEFGSRFYRGQASRGVGVSFDLSICVVSKPAANAALVGSRMRCAALTGVI